MKNLAELLTLVDPRAEPARDQRGVLDGATVVTIQVVLDRTAIVHDGNGNGLRLVRLDRLDVDERELRWQPKAAATSQLLLAVAQRRARRAQQVQTS